MNSRRAAVVLAGVVAVLAAWLALRGCSEEGERPVEVRDAPVAAQPDRAPERAPDRVRVRPDTDTDTRGAATEPVEPEDVAVDPTGPTRLVVTVLLPDWETPVPGALVEARMADRFTRLQDSDWTWSATTDGDGVVTLAVRPEAVDVRASHGAEAALVMTVPVPAGTTEHCGLVLLPATTVTGVVLDWSGAEVPGAIVTLSPAASPRHSGPDTSVFGVADVNGTFVLSGVPISGLTHLTAFVSALGRPTGMISFEPDELSVPPHLVLRLQDVRIEGRCVTSDGTPVAGAPVTMSNYGGIGTVTGADGRFAFRSETDGKTHMLVRPPEHAHQRRLLPEPDADGVVRVGVVTLEAAGSIAGVIVEPDGSPGFGAKVGLVPPGSRLPIDRAVTDMAGKFAFEHVATGTHELRVRPREASRHAVSTVLHEAVAGETSLRIVLPVQVPLRVVFVSARSGEPITATSLRIKVTDPNSGLVVHDESRFGSDGLDAVDLKIRGGGTYDVTVAVRGFRLLDLEGVRIEGESVVEIRAELVPVSD